VLISVTELLFGYGFALESNQADSVAVKLGQPRKPPNAGPKADDISQMLNLLGLSTNRHVIFKDGGAPEELLAQMRLYLANQDDMAIVQERIAASSRWQDVLSTISIDNEVRARTTCKICSYSLLVQIVVREQLLNMLSIKLAGLNSTHEEEEEEELPRKRARGSDAAFRETSKVRPEVARLIGVYKDGQRLILNQAIQVQKAKYDQLVQEAEALYEGQDSMEMD
jgi:hypothetical protein